VTVRAELGRPQIYLKHEEHTVADKGAFKYCHGTNYMFGQSAYKRQFEESLC